MKKSKKTALTALLLTSAVSMTSCNWFLDTFQNVYGPPVDISTEPPSDEISVTENIETDEEGQNYESE